MKIHFRGHQFARAIFLLLSFQSTNIQTSENKKDYKTYFQQQEKIYQELVNSGISGARPLNMDEILAESVLANCSQEIEQIIFNFEYRVFSANKKNIIFHGPSGTGKSALAQAIAIKSQVPCLFFNVGTISTEYKDSGVQNLNKIFNYAQGLEKISGRPCIVIFDELEAWTKKHTSVNSSENNILTSFWQELDRISKSKVIVIGTMNNTEDVPEQILTRTSMIKIPLPNVQQTEAILSYHLKKRQEAYNLAYPESLTAAYLAQQTKIFYKRFSNRDLENLVEEATRPVIKTPALLDGNKKIVPVENFVCEIKKIQWQFIEKWGHTFKKHLRDPKITIPLLGIAVMFGVGCNTILNQRKSFDLQKKSMDMQKDNHKEGIAIQKAHQEENVAMQEKSAAIQMSHHKESMEFQIANQKENLAMQEKSLIQSKQIADYQTSFDHMSKQAKINSIPWQDYAMTWKDHHSNEEIAINAQWLSLNLPGFHLNNKVLQNAK
ncbi:AAA family ATPase [Candidatus Babeliales bacterium]|nr:AAA family ATPase [Candidatus Babeliales bacterium]